MSPDLFRRALPYLLAIAGALACLWWAYSHGVSVTDTEWQGKWDKQSAELATARADAEIAARKAEQRRLADMDRVRQDAEKQIANAERDAADADAAAVGLREQASRLALRASQCASHSGIAQSGDTAGQSAVVLADLLGRADARAGELARAYDRARASGLACQRAYLSLTNPD